MRTWSLLCSPSSVVPVAALSLSVGCLLALSSGKRTDWDDAGAEAEALKLINHRVVTEPVWRQAGFWRPRPRLR